MVATKETKYSFRTDEVEPQVDRDSLVKAILDRTENYPHVKVGEHPEVAGIPGETGLVIYAPEDGNGSGPIYGTVRHPRFIPVQMVEGRVEYNGPQTAKHVERSLLFAAPDQYVQQHATSLINDLSIPRVGLKELGEFNYGATAGGSEPEAWMIDSDGNPYNVVDGGELQGNLCEESIGAIASPTDFLAARAKQILDRKARYPGAIIVDTSCLTVGRPDQVEVNANGEIGPYIQAVQQLIHTDLMHNYHPLSQALMDQLAQNFNFDDWSDMHQGFGNMAYLVFAASHLSIGLPHVRKGNEALSIPEQEAIAVADIFNSNLATLAELLMFSTPFIYGTVPTLELDGQICQPRDVRSVMRLTVDTCYPAPFIRTPQEYRARVKYQIINGLSHTLDRAAYMAVINDPRTGEQVERPVMHGRVRLRAASNEPMNMTGRVEYTGCSASPSLYDEAARNSFLQLLTVAAYEALANGQHPIEYFAQEFPNLARWEEQQSLALEASLKGFQTPRIRGLIDEGIRLIDYLEQRYSYTDEEGVRKSNLEPQCSLARERLLNLLQPPAASLKDYLENPVGPFCEVVQQELAEGQSALEVTKHIEEYQLAVASQISSSRTDKGSVL